MKWFLLRISALFIALFIYTGDWYYSYSVTAAIIFIIEAFLFAKQVCIIFKWKCKIKLLDELSENMRS